MKYISKVVLPEARRKLYTETAYKFLLKEVNKTWS